MWGLPLEKISNLLGPEGLGRIAIETGTCRGNGARALSRRFERVITIELDAILFAAAKARNDLPNVEFVWGNSAVELARILPTLPNEPIFFYLDAHWSGDDSVNWGESQWKGYGLNTAHLGTGAPSASEQCPLLEELEVISKYCAGPARILIDDMKNIPAVGSGRKDHTFQGEDWSHLSRDSLLAAVGARLRSRHNLSDPEQWFLELGPA